MVHALRLLLDDFVPALADVNDAATLVEGLDELVEKRGDQRACHGALPDLFGLGLGKDLHLHVADVALEAVAGAVKLEVPGDFPVFGAVKHWVVHADQLSVREQLHNLVHAPPDHHFLRWVRVDLS